MKRIALLLAAAGLGSGCVIESTPDVGTAAVYWAFESDLLGTFSTVNDSATEACAAAAVNDLDVTLVDPAGYTWGPYAVPCIPGNDVPGTVFSDLEPGTWDVYVDAYRGGEWVFEGAQTFDVWAGDRTTVDTLLGARHWDVQIGYTTTGCFAGETIEFDLFEIVGLTANLAYSTYDGSVNPPVAIPCVNSGTFVIPSVPPGDYEFSNWVHYEADGVTPVAYSACVPWWTQTSASNEFVDVAVTAGTPGDYCL